MGLFGIAFVVMAALKLAHIITWSWWLVFSPLIIWAIICLIVWVAALSKFD